MFWVFWQGLVFAVLSGFGLIPPSWKYSSWEFALVLNNAIITVEMFSVAGFCFFFARKRNACCSQQKEKVLHVFAYPYDVYRVSVQSQRPLVASNGE